MASELNKKLNIWACPNLVAPYKSSFFWHIQDGKTYYNFSYRILRKPQHELLCKQDIFIWIFSCRCFRFPLCWSVRFSTRSNIRGSKLRKHSAPKQNGRLVRQWDKLSLRNNHSMVLITLCLTLDGCTPLCACNWGIFLQIRGTRGLFI